MLTDFLNAAIRHAAYEKLEDDEGWFGQIPPLQGVWASEKTVGETRYELRSVLEDWRHQRRPPRADPPRSRGQPRRVGVIVVGGDFVVASRIR